MKSIIKYILIILFSCNACSLFAQNFISENKLWRYGVTISGDPQNPFHRNEAFRFKGDTVINDTTYNKLYISEDEFLLKWKFYRLWRETKDNKIYERKPNYYPPYKIEELMYDFNLAKNDTFIALGIGIGISLKVDSVLSKLWGGKLRKHWYLYPVHAEEDTIKEWYKTLWVEGVGQINYFPSNVGVNYGAKLFPLCFEENGQQVYQNPDYNTCFYTSLNDIPNLDKGFKVYPNPVSGELFIQPSSNTEEAFTLEMYSVKGELVKTECLEQGSTLHRIDVSSLRNGIYILRLISSSGKYDEKVIIKE